MHGYWPDQIIIRHVLDSDWTQSLNCTLMLSNVIRDKIIKPVQLFLVTLGC